MFSSKNLRFFKFDDRQQRKGKENYGTFQPCTFGRQVRDL